nr:[FeFe] hydrogenase H-cluster maturation GTPase HydF [uncultured Desulfobulbus sp.]
MMQTAPKGLRLHIGLFGRRNVGKSSLLNAITRQQAALVSSHAGTTTDPVEKPMELLPLGPVLFIDTAGIDDVGALGEVRIARTRAVFDRTDLGVLVTEAGLWGDFEEELLAALADRDIPVVVVVNKVDQEQGAPPLVTTLQKQKFPVVKTSALNGTGIGGLKQAIIQEAPAGFVGQQPIVSDLVGPGETVVLVVPIDKEAPKGRLILPQVQTLRDLLDGDCISLVVKERELRQALAQLQRPPKLVVTDSQVFLKVAADIPPEVPLTSFSILFSRNKGDLLTQVEGALAIDQLQPGDKVLIAEACSHHPIGEDLGTVKIPRWLTQYVGGKLAFTHVQGHDFPENLPDYKLVIQCGSCMLNRREVLSRIVHCREAGVPITNYGLAISFSLGIFTRALSPFPAALELVRSDAGGY